MQPWLLVNLCRPDIAHNGPDTRAPSVSRLTPSSGGPAIDLGGAHALGRTSSAAVDPFADLPAVRARQVAAAAIPDWDRPSRPPSPDVGRPSPPSSWSSPVYGADILIVHPRVVEQRRRAALEVHVVAAVWTAVWVALSLALPDVGRDTRAG